MEIKFHQPEVAPEISHWHDKDTYSTASVGQAGELTWFAHRLGVTIQAKGCPECIEVFPKTVTDALKMAG